MKKWMGFIGMAYVLSGCVHQSANQAPALTSEAEEHVVEIASKQLVRVVTPFSNPRVLTTSEADIQRSQNVLYVLSEGDEPISMFVTDGESERDALSLVLTPKDNGKREVSFSSQIAKVPEKLMLKAPPTAVRPASSKQRAPAPKVAQKQQSDGLQCRLCRNKDDENGYSGSSW